MITRVFQGLLSHVPFVISPGSLSSSRNFWYFQMPESLLTKQPTGSLHELTISNIHWHLQYYHLLISTTVYDTIPPKKKTHDFSFREKKTHASIHLNASTSLHLERRNSWLLNDIFQQVPELMLPSRELRYATLGKRNLIYSNILLMDKIRLTSLYGKYPLITRVLYIQGGAGFLPWTVPWLGILFSSQDGFLIQ